jgi:AraC family transcriptional regulator
LLPKNPSDTREPPTIAAPIRFERGRAMLLAGVRQRHALSATAPDIARQWQQLKSLGDLPGRVGTTYYGVMCGADAASFEYMCGVEVESFAHIPDGVGRMRVPEQEYAVFAHRGDASALRSAWLQILEWLANGEYDSAHKPDFELYRDHADAFSGAGPIEIWVGVVPRRGRKREYGR